MTYTINFLTTIQEPQSTGITGIDIAAIIVVGNIAFFTYMIRSYKSRPVIEFKYSTDLDRVYRSINYTVEGELPSIYRYIPFLIYKKMYIARFVLVNSNTIHSEYNLPFNFFSLRSAIEEIYKELVLYDEAYMNYTRNFISARAEETEFLRTSRNMNSPRYLEIERTV
jgi:hypothetical protein